MSMNPVLNKSQTNMCIPYIKRVYYPYLKDLIRITKCTKLIFISMLTKNPQSHLYTPKVLGEKKNILIKINILRSLMVMTEQE